MYSADNSSSSSSSSSATTATMDHYCIHTLDESNNLLTIERRVPTQLAAYTRIHSATADSCWALSNVAVTDWRCVLYFR
jgi:prophage DNA circulation protein